MASFGIQFRSNAPTGVIGKVLASIFFSAFLALGAFFLWMILREEVDALRTWTWRKTPCEILTSQVRETDARGRRTGNFYFEVQYRYTFAGQTFTSDQCARKPRSSSDYRTMARLAARYPGESQATCYVNPSRPSEAVLAREDLYLLLFAVIPLVFIGIGAGALYCTWKPKPATDPNRQAISVRASPTKVRSFNVFIGAVFLLLGSAAFWFAFIRPVYDIVLARSWPEVPCVVLSSQVHSQRGSKGGTTYRVDILYRYEVNGREFESNRYHFLGGSSSGYHAKAAVVNQHPPGSRTVCYVNPADPTYAVLERGFTADMWIGVLPLLFMGIGVFLISAELRTPRQGAPAAGAARSLSSGAATREAGAVLSAARATESVLLKPKTAPWLKLVGVTVAALFWNGLVSIFLVEVVQGWRSGRGAWGLTLFLVPFVLVGLGLLAGIGYSFLALFNPRPRLRVAPGAVPLGCELRVEWELSGRANVLQKLELRLQGREEATYRRGTSTTTDTNVFFDLELASLTNPYELRSGTRTVTIPGNLMHSFASKNNKITWVLRLHGDIPRWPDINEEFPLTVAPAARPAKAAL